MSCGRGEGWSQTAAVFHACHAMASNGFDIGRRVGIDDQDAAQVRQLACDRLQRVEPGTVHDRQRRAATLQLMAEEAAGQLGVEQHGHGTNPPKAEPHAHEIQAAGQEHGHHLAGLDPQTGEEPGHSRDVRIGLTEGERATLCHLDPAAIRLGPGLFSQDVGQNPSTLISQTGIHGWHPYPQRSARRSLYGLGAVPPSRQPHDRPGDARVSTMCVHPKAWGQKKASNTIAQTIPQPTHVMVG